MRLSPRCTLFPYTTLFRSGALNGSTTTVTPSHSNSWSPSWAPRSKPRPYWKPEHPPPSIATRRTETSSSLASSSLIFAAARSEEHTSELQSHSDLVCRLLLDAAVTKMYTLSLHDALPIWGAEWVDDDGDPLALELVVALLGAAVEAEAVLETGASAALDRDAEDGDVLFAREQLADLRGSEIGRAHV